MHLPRFIFVDLYLGLASVARTGQGGQEFRSQKKARFIQEVLKMLAWLSKSHGPFLASGRLGREGSRTL